MKLYQITEDCGLLLYIRGCLICQSRDFKKRKGRLTTLLIHPFFSFFFKFLEFEDHSVVDVLVRETNRYAKQHLTCYLVIKTYLVRTRVSGIIFIRYALIQNISEPNNFEIFDSKKTTVKGPKLNSQKST